MMNLGPFREIPPESLFSNEDVLPHIVTVALCARMPNTLPHDVAILPEHPSLG